MSSAGNLRKDADELIRLAMLTESENVKRILTSEATKLVQVAEAEEKLNPGAQQKVPRSTTRPTVTTSKLYNYGWDQSEKFLKIYVTLDGVHNFDASSTSSHFEEKSFELQVLDKEKKINYVLSVKNLLYPIVPSSSYSKVKTDMVVLYLKKASSQNWGFVTEVEKRAKDAKAPKLDKTDQDPGASLMTMMKQMYDDGDDDMKRTIAKAWTEARDKKSPDDVL